MTFPSFWHIRQLFTRFSMFESSVFFSSALSRIRAGGVISLSKNNHQVNGGEEAGHSIINHVAYLGRRAVCPIRTLSRASITGLKHSTTDALTYFPSQRHTLSRTRCAADDFRFRFDNEIGVLLFSFAPCLSITGPMIGWAMRRSAL